MEQRGRRWSDQEILDAIRDWADRHDGVPPGWNDWRKADPKGRHPTSMTVWTRCGSWNDALVMAGFEPTRYGATPGQLNKPEVRRLRKKGVTDTDIAAQLGVTTDAIRRALGPRGRPPAKPRNAEERRVARIEALRKALAKR